MEQLVLQNQVFHQVVLVPNLTHHLVRQQVGDVLRELVLVQIMPLLLKIVSDGEREWERLRPPLFRPQKSPLLEFQENLICQLHRRGEMSEWHQLKEARVGVDSLHRDLDRVGQHPAEGWVDTIVGHNHNNNNNLFSVHYAVDLLEKVL